jgi:hypothetical protein
MVKYMLGIVTKIKRLVFNGYIKGVFGTVLIHCELETFQFLSRNNSWSNQNHLVKSFGPFVETFQIQWKWEGSESESFETPILPLQYKNFKCFKPIHHWNVLIFSCLELLQKIQAWIWNVSPCQTGPKSQTWLFLFLVCRSKHIVLAIVDKSSLSQ